jgi:putative SOS response-associated peptidase YedK
LYTVPGTPRKILFHDHVSQVETTKIPNPVKEILMRALEFNSVRNAKVATSLHTQYMEGAWHHTYLYIICYNCHEVIKMCGRFTLSAPIEEIVSRFDVESFLQQDDYLPSYNIAPSQSVLAVINNGSINKMGYLRWGLVPPWAKDLSIGYKMINARAETLAEKPSFKTAYRKKRCLIIADGFYEWKRHGDKTKTPMRIKLKSDELFGMAGLWEHWKSPEGESIFSCTVITTVPNELMKDIHDRMPVILKPEDEKIWLDPTISDPDYLSQFLKPLDSDLMEAYEVSPLVNSPKNNSAELIRRIC